MKSFHSDVDPTELVNAQAVPAAGRSFGDYCDDAAWSKRAREVLSVKLRYQSPNVRWAGSDALVLQCESGLMADGLVRRGCEVTAADTRSYMVELAKARSRSNGYRVHYRQVEDLAKLPFLDASFDIVLCDHVLERVRNYAPIISEAARVLRPGGGFLFSSVNPSLRSRIFGRLCPELMMPGLPKTIAPLHMVRPGALRRHLADAGFEECRMRGLRLRPFSVLNRPTYRVSSGRPMIYVGTATRA